MRMQSHGRSSDGFSLATRQTFIAAAMIGLAALLVVVAPASIPSRSLSLTLIGFSVLSQIFSRARHTLEARAVRVLRRR